MKMEKKDLNEKEKAEGKSETIEEVSAPAAKMLPLWFWIGLILTIYGLLIFSTGIYHIYAPSRGTKLAEINPSLWWGTIMLLSGIIFLVTSMVKSKR